MTIPDETGSSEQYDEISFVEFIELLGRLAVIKFMGTPQIKSWSLLDRLETIVEAFLKFVGVKTIKIDLANLYATESDDDY